MKCGGAPKGGRGPDQVADGEIVETIEFALASIVAPRQHISLFTVDQETANMAFNFRQNACLV